MCGYANHTDMIARNPRWDKIQHGLKPILPTLKWSTLAPCDKAVLGFEFRSFEFVSGFDIRISDFKVSYERSLTSFCSWAEA
jgi:hypothetical protein